MSTRKVEALLAEAEEEAFIFDDFPPEHRRQIDNTNPLYDLPAESARCISTT